MGIPNRVCASSPVTTTLASAEKVTDARFNNEVNLGFVRYRYSGLGVEWTHVGKVYASKQCDDVPDVIDGCFQNLYQCACTKPVHLLV